VLNKSTENKEKKSLKERFFLVIGIVFFLAYLAMGVTIIVWKNFPYAMKPIYRIAFGGVIVLYSFFRFYRIINDNKD
jgi:predicted ferric reductase